ncbi:MATE family efflux transporter [Aliikangiella coralliicola]|uniref:MATE family efflux transporter n=1 Tax=Aliikangiella coralliicola TaxID=2592383 RepID=A0A545UEN7_9GAMM|nr:MATE family efflux transporter [Aliikangiella coralliicola]TQV87934.1 MATE family efflux transporter [Aliikangiella coralliicola]
MKPCVKKQQRISRSQWMLSHPVVDVLSRLTRPMLPAILAVMSLDLYDIYLVSQLGTQSLAALSFTIPITSILFAVAIGLTIGTTAVLSHSLGKGDHHETQRLVTDSFLFSSTVAILLGIIGIVTIKPLFHYLGANYALIPDSFHLGPKPDIMPLITEYMQLRYLGFVFMLIPLLANGVMRAVGDAQFAGRLMLSWAILTALLDSLLMWQAGENASLIDIGKGHLIADSLTSIVSMVLLVKREKLLIFERFSQTEFWCSLRRLLHIGLPAISISLLTPIAFAIVTSWVAFYGREAVAAFGVLSRIETVALFLPMALSTSLPIFIGQNYAANLINRCCSAIRKSLLISLAVQLVVYIALVTGANQIAQQFSDSPQVTHLIVYMLWFLPLGYLGQGVVILVVSSLNAMHRPKTALVLSVIRMFGLLVPFAYLGAYLGSLDGLFISMMISNLLIGIIAYLWLNRICSREYELNISPKVESPDLDTVNS